MADLQDVITRGLITSARQNLINEYIEKGTHRINTSAVYIGGIETISPTRTWVGNLVVSGNISANNLSGINTGDQESSDFNLSDLSDVDDTDKSEGKILKVNSEGKHIYVNDESGTDEKVKYDANDPTAGYIVDKFVAGTGITFTEGTGADENKLIITNSDKGSDVDLSGKEDVGVAEGLVEGHESTYDHSLIATALQSETDPVFSSWDKSTGISITESQISDLQSYLLDIAGQDLSTADNSNSEFITIDDVPSALLLDQTTPQAFTNGTVTGSGNLVVVSGVLGLDTGTYLDTTTAGNTYARIDGQVFTGNISAPNLSGTNTGDSSGHENLATLTNLANKSSIKRTTSFSRTWATGEHPYIKSKQVFLANEDFVRVYKDDVLLTYTTDWSFNNTAGKKIGAVADLVDGVLINSPVDGSTYKVEFDEWVIPFSPTIVLCRSDGKMISRGLPKNYISGGDGPSGLITSITPDDDPTYTYTAAYANPAPSFTITYYYPNRAFVGDYKFNATLPTNWRIELYKQGRWWATRRKSEAGSLNTTMNSVLSPRETYTTNIINLDDYVEKKHTGRLKLRMRNTVTNEVSLFSIQSIKIKRYNYLSRTWTSLGMPIVRASLD